ncbi:dihydrofolate reductase [Patescibacteria group bacterium]
MISMIAIVGKNNAIGKNNALIWDISNDLRHFQKITSGHTVIMGDKTYESIGMLLPNRKNIIVTLDEAYEVEGAEVRNSLEEVLSEYKDSDEEVFVIGGGIIYGLSLPFADKLYITLVDDAPEDADTFFPDYSEFSQELSKEDHQEGDLKYSFLELTK